MAFTNMLGYFQAITRKKVLNKNIIITNLIEYCISANLEQVTNYINNNIVDYDTRLLCISIISYLLIITSDNQTVDLLEIYIPILNVIKPVRIQIIPDSTLVFIKDDKHLCEFILNVYSKLSPIDEYYISIRKTLGLEYKHYEEMRQLEMAFTKL
jgi:branched-subunit amino acid permease